MPQSDLSTYDRARDRLERAQKRAEERWWDREALREMDRARRAVTDAQRHSESEGQQALFSEETG